MRNYGLIQGLAERHQISLLSFSEPGQAGGRSTASLEAAGPLLTLCQRVETVPAPPPRRLMRRALQTLTHPLPDMALRLASTAFARQLTSWLTRETFDVVHVEGIEMTPYLDQLLDADTMGQTPAGKHQRSEQDGERGIRSVSPIVIFDDHNCEYMLQKSYARVDARLPRHWPGAFYSLVQWQKLRRYEAQACARAHHVLAVSRADAEALEQLVPGLTVTVIPNGIDTDVYKPDSENVTLESDAGQVPTVVFTGKMDFRPNVDAVSWFAEAIWPQVRAEVPQARFFIVGQRPHPRLEPLRADTSLTLTGWVDEVRPYIAKATVYVAPLRMGSGTRLKLLEAMALGKAIVSTRMGAEGLMDAELEPSQGPVRTNDPRGATVTDDRELILVDDDDPVAFANAVVALLRDPARRARLGSAARAFVEAHYDWRVIIPRLETLYAQH